MCVCPNAWQSACVGTRSLSVCPDKATTKGVQRPEGTEGAGNKGRGGGQEEQRFRGKGEREKGGERRESGERRAQGGSEGKKSNEGRARKKSKHIGTSHRPKTAQTDNGAPDCSIRGGAMHNPGLKHLERGQETGWQRPGLEHPERRGAKKRH